MNNIYNIYLTFGTIPSLYSEISILLDKIPSCLFVRSSGDFNFNYLEKLDYVLNYYKFIGGDQEYLNEGYKEVKNSLVEIKKKNENAKFNIYIDDSRVQFYIKPFIEAKALNDINNIIILSEGNITAQMFYQINDGYFEETAAKWNKLIKNYNDNDLSIIDNYSFWLSTKKNVKYLLPYYNKFNCNIISKEKFNKMNLGDFTIEKKFNKLSKADKKILYNYKLDVFDLKQKNLIIIGSYDLGSKDLTYILYKNLIDQILYDYSDYKIFYKPHPIFPVFSNKKLEEYLKSRKIEIIAENVPLEMILWQYDNIVIGGFSSSINSLIELNRTKFIFGSRIGYTKIIYDDSQYIPKIYNIEVSQIMGADLIQYNTSCEFVIEKLKEKLERLEIEKEVLREKIDFINSDLLLLKTELKQINEENKRNIIHKLFKILKK